MKRYILILAMLMAGIASYAAVGDETRLSPSQIQEIRKEVSITKSGKEKTEIIVIYIENGKRKAATMTQTDYKKLERAKKYNLTIDFYLVEMKSKYKIVVK